MNYFSFTLIVKFIENEESKVFNDIIAIDKESALADIASAYGETPELLGFKQNDC